MQKQQIRAYKTISIPIETWRILKVAAIERTMTMGQLVASFAARVRPRLRTPLWPGVKDTEKPVYVGAPGAKRLATAQEHEEMRILGTAVLEPKKDDPDA